MDLFTSELKRQIGGRKFIDYMLISILIGALWAWFIIGGETEGFMNTHCYKGLRGMSAIKTAAKDRNVYSGKMTVDKFQKSGEIFLNSINRENEIVINEDLLKLAVYADLLNTQDYKLKSILGDNKSKALNFSRDFGSHFYENENLYYENLIAKNTSNKAEKELAYKMWKDVEKPYTYYGGFEVWRNGIEHIQLLALVLLIIVGFFSSGIIAKDKETGLDEIISSTKKGRVQLLFSKLLISVTMGFLIYVVGMGTYIAILKHYLPDNALKTSAQVWTTTIVPYNLGEVMDKMVILGLIGTLSFSAFSSLISSISKETSKAMKINVLVIVSGFLVSVMLNLNNSIFKLINLILPGSLVFSYCKFTIIPIVYKFGRAFLSLKFSLFISIVIFLISLIMTSWNYIRR